MGDCCCWLMGVLAYKNVTHFKCDPVILYFSFRIFRCFSNIFHHHLDIHQVCSPLSATFGFHVWCRCQTTWELCERRESDQSLEAEAPTEPRSEPFLFLGFSHISFAFFTFASRCRSPVWLPIAGPWGSQGQLEDRSRLSGTPLACSLWPHCCLFLFFW